MDFTFKTFEKLLNALLVQGFSFLTFTQYTEAKSHNLPLTSHLSPLIVLRHDVEARYPNALRIAQIENSLGIKGSYYFRIFQNQDNEHIINQIAAMGHEIGYHYDDFSVCKGDRQNALERFKKNLTYLRQFGRVTTITMEGAPLSKYDNRQLWKQPIPHHSSLTAQSSTQISHYTHYGILAEPYFDLNFNQMFYLTDTGRCWDGHRFNVRDKATIENPVTNPEFLRLHYHTTQDIINAVNHGTFPKQAMLNFHPQRWNDKPLPWLKELVWQNIKNQGKRMLIRVRSGK